MEVFGELARAVEYRMVNSPWYFGTRLKPVNSADYRLKLYALAIDSQFCVSVKGLNEPN